jgi:hypothetical protein
MPDGEQGQGAPAKEAAPAPSREPASTPSHPEPPPYRPDKDLIGYIEKGQKPPETPETPAKAPETRDKQG